jgi:hypothetical protein
MNMTHRAGMAKPKKQLFFLIAIVGGVVQLGLLSTAATNRPIVPAPGDYDDEKIGGIIGRGTEVQWYLGIRSLWNKFNLVYVLSGHEKFCLVYDLCLGYDSCART